MASHHFLPYICTVLRRLVISLILFSMMLHCAGRIGLISYIYEQRQEIALALGLIDEIPIAMCSHEYEPNDGLTIHEIHQSESTVPQAAFTSQEIHLFISQVGLHATEPYLAGLAVENKTAMIESYYLQPTLTIFHPPC